MTDTEQKQKNMRTLLMFVLATLAVIAVIAVLFIGNLRQSRRDGIVLPDAAQTQQTQPQQPTTESPTFLEIDRENVQNIVRYLSRPQYYHQTYTITRQMSGAQSQTQAELWVSDRCICAVLSAASGEKHILTDGQVLYVWYASDKTVRQLAASADMTMDELIGIPTYEQIDTLRADTITDGAFIPEDEEDGGQQIFVAAEEDALRREYWISLDTGLLTKSLITSGGETIYEALQTGLELLAAGDEAFDDVYLLPDGSAPFAQQD